MPGAESFDEQNIGEVAHMQALQLTVIDLGANSTGSLGPTDLADTERKQIVEDTAKAEYSRPASNRWICVDGRVFGSEMEAVDEDHEADPQIAGSLPVSESAASFMLQPAGDPLSIRIADKTKAAIADGLEVVVHGDDHAGEAGCAANVRMRDVLRFNAANADIVVPKVWALVQLLGLDEHVTQDDLIQLTLGGINAAGNETLWDATPEEVIKIAVDSGASYDAYHASHNEKAARVDLTDGAFAKARYVKDHSSEEREIQVFSASFGRYATETFRRAKLHGKSERDAALETSAVWLYNAGLTKTLITEDTDIAIITNS